MKKKTLLLFASLSVYPAFSQVSQTVKWTLRECIDYALENNIKIKTDKLSFMSSEEDVKESEAALFPSLSLSTTQKGGYTPFAEKEQNAVNKLNYTGDYGVNASWTVWNGNRNRNNIKLKKLSSKKAQLSVDESINSIQEQILELYLKILYTAEAVNVNKQILDMSRNNAGRGEEMYKVGSISKADLSQLKAQVAADEYNLINIEGQLKDFKLQMKDLLELDHNCDFNIVIPESSAVNALITPLDAEVVIANALASRPEMRNAVLGMESGNLNIDIAKASLKPTISLSGGVGTGTVTGTGNTWSRQMKNNLNGSLGVTLSVPIFDNRSAKTAQNKAKIELQQLKLETENVRKGIELDIQRFYINAVTNQERFKSARISVESAQDSYSLLSEQFNLGLKNIVELTNAKTVLINAQQSCLESKYTAILYLQLLKFYNGEDINLI